MLHIAREDAWRDAQRSGTYCLPSGVIHGCSRTQLSMVVEAHFPALDGWVVLTVDEARALGEVRLVTHAEGTRSETFPHIHGTFPVSAVSRVEALSEALASSTERRAPDDR